MGLPPVIDGTDSHSHSHAHMRGRMQVCACTRAHAHVRTHTRIGGAAVPIGRGRRPSREDKISAYMHFKGADKPAAASDVLSRMQAILMRDKEVIGTTVPEAERHGDGLELLTERRLSTPNFLDAPSIGMLPHAARPPDYGARESEVEQGHSSAQIDSRWMADSDVRQEDGPRPSDKPLQPHMGSLANTSEPHVDARLADARLGMQRHIDETCEAMNVAARDAALPSALSDAADGVESAQLHGKRYNSCVNSNWNSDSPLPDYPW